MKKISLVHFAYPPNIGGVESMVKEHAGIFTGLGYEVTIIAGSGEESNPKIKLNIIPELQSILNFNPFLQERILNQGVIDEEFYKLSSIIEGKLVMALEDIDVVIIHNMVSLVHNLPFVNAFKNYVKKFPNKKYFGWIHDHAYITEFKIKDVQKVAKSKEEFELLTTPIKNLTYILISESFREPFLKLMGLKKDETVVIPDGIDMKSFLEIDDLVWEVVDKYNLLKKFPLVLSPVNIIERKNLDYCLDIIYALKKDFPDIGYIITGKTSQHRSTLDYYNSLKKKIDDLGLKENVMFFNDFLKRALVRSEIHDLYQVADMVFFLSKSENFGLPLLEAAVTKTPILVSDLKVFREVGGNFIKYINYRETTPLQTAEIMKNFIDKSLRVKMNHRCRTEYDLKTILKERFVPMIERN